MGVGVDFTQWVKTVTSVQTGAPHVQILVTAVRVTRVSTDLHVNGHAHRGARTRSVTKIAAIVLTAA